MKPKDGIKYLIGIGHFQDTPKDIANFLYTADGLDKGQIGEYLGGHTELHRHVRNEYVDNNFRFAVIISFFSFSFSFLFFFF